MKTFVKSLFAIMLLSLCACKGNHQQNNNYNDSAVVPEKYPATGDTPFVPDSVRSDSAMQQKDTSKTK